MTSAKELASTLAEAETPAGPAGRRCGQCGDAGGDRRRGHDHAATEASWFDAHAQPDRTPEGATTSR